MKNKTLFFKKLNLVYKNKFGYVSVAPFNVKTVLRIRQRYGQYMYYFHNVAPDKSYSVDAVELMKHLSIEVSLLEKYNGFLDKKQGEHFNFLFNNKIDAEEFIEEVLMPFYIANSLIETN